MSWLLALIPAPLRLWAGAVALSSLLALITWQVHVQREIGRDQIRQEWAASISEQRADALKRSEANAREINRILKEQEIAQDEQAKEIQRNAAAAARADAVASSLRNQLAKYVAANSGRANCTASATGQQQGEQGADPIVVLADLFGRASQRAGELASLADTLRTVAVGCERYSEVIR